MVNDVQHYKVGQVYEVYLYESHDWVMLVHVECNKVVAICSDGNRYRNPRVVCNRHNIMYSEFCDIMGRPSIGEIALALHISDDNVNYPKTIDRFYMGGAVSYGTVLTKTAEPFIVAQVDSSIYGLVTSDGELLAAPVRVNDGRNITRRELFQMGATADMYVVGKAYNVLTFSKVEDMSDAERSE